MSMRFDNKRYDGRVLDMDKLMREPLKPVPWRADRLVADGYSTVLAGRSGARKTFLALALGGAVGAGASVGGLGCAKGHTVYFDAENGAREIKQRMHALRIPANAMTLVDASGLTIAADLPWMGEVIRRLGANLAVFDSLRRLAPQMDEDRSNDTAPIMAALSVLARETEAGVLVLHHRSVKPGSPAFRGSSAIQDQADLLFTLDRVVGEANRYKLKTEKCRIDREPDPRFLTIEHRDGLAYIGEDERPEHEQTRHSELRDGLRALGDETIKVGGLSRVELAKRVGVEPLNGSLQRVLAELRDRGEWTIDDDARPPLYRACFASNGETPMIGRATSDPSGG